MNFLKKLLDKNLDHNASETIESFWNWFSKNETKFFNVLKSDNRVEEDFINPVFKRLNNIKEGVFVVAGMKNDDQAELILTAEGSLKNFPFVYDLIAKAPVLKQWLFTPLKPPMDIDNVGIDYQGFQFKSENIAFIAPLDDNRPDEIIVKLIYLNDYSETSRAIVENGTYIFVESHLGEQFLITEIDQLLFDHTKDGEKIPIEKLKSYISWRKKEFLEKYDGTFFDSDSSTYSSMEWEAVEKSFLGIVNADLMLWDKKASHPWICEIEMEFKGKLVNGFPQEKEIELVYDFEDLLRTRLQDKEGYLQLVHITGDGKRTTYIACKDYHNPIRELELLNESSNFVFKYEIFKDKYWNCVNWFEEAVRENPA